MQIHPHARYVCERLQRRGFTAWIVGGAVRDLLRKGKPKDFDVATSANPRQAVRLFPNARLIGRRFPLAMLRFPGMEIELSSFRGGKRNPAGTPFAVGSPREDMLRRDFTVNALGLDAKHMVLWDYVCGLEDLRHCTLRTVRPVEASLLEDPVRMLRAVRLGLRLDFAWAPDLEPAILRLGDSLAGVNRHRLCEELQRFLVRGQAERSFAELQRLNLLHTLVGVEAHRALFGCPLPTKLLEESRVLLCLLDSWRAAGAEPVAPTLALLALILSLAPADWRNGFVAAAPSWATQQRMLPHGLAQWGFLRGQVEPACAILNAAQSLLRQHRRTSQVPSRASDADTPFSLDAEPLLGLREAWILLLLLREKLALPQEFLRCAPGQLERLPDLPILDHPRPRKGALLIPKAWM